MRKVLNGQLLILSARHWLTNPLLQHTTKFFFPPEVKEEESICFWKQTEKYTLNEADGIIIFDFYLIR